MPQMSVALVMAVTMTGFVTLVTLCGPGPSRDYADRVKPVPEEPQLSAGVSRITDSGVRPVGRSGYRQQRYAQLLPVRPAPS